MGSKKKDGGVPPSTVETRIAEIDTALREKEAADKAGGKKDTKNEPPKRRHDNAVARPSSFWTEGMGAVVIAIPILLVIIGGILAVTAGWINLP
jgi:hypothetical protein